MELIKDIIIVALIFVAVLGGVITADILRPQLETVGGYNDTTLPSLTAFSTTTGSFCSMCPVQLLASNPNRKYVVVTNPSDTAIFLYATTTALTYNITGELTNTATNATSVIAVFPHNGIRVASGGTYEFDFDNLLIGYLYASSTASSKQINVSYK